MHNYLSVILGNIFDAQDVFMFFAELMQNNFGCL